VIDLHAHVLHGIDDGPATLPEAVEAVAAASREGVRVLAATPHVRPDHPEVRPAELGDRTAALARGCAAAGVADVELVPGGELDLAWAQTATDEALAAASYGRRGRDLLVETPYGELPAGFEELVFRISARGFRVLLAHPERNPTLQRDPRRLRALVERGTLLQLTAAALASRDRRSRSRRLAHALLREGAAHIIASDRHGADVVRAGLRAGVDAAARESGARATWMVTDAPAAILASEPLPPPPAVTPRRSRLSWPRRG
jgi:protein-tyrosine phosphatase